MRAVISFCVRRFGAVTVLTLVAFVLGVWGALKPVALIIEEAQIKAHEAD